MSSVQDHRCTCEPTLEQCLVLSKPPREHATRPSYNDTQLNEERKKPTKPLCKHTTFKKEKQAENKNRQRKKKPVQPTSALTESLGRRTFLLHNTCAQDPQSHEKELTPGPRVAKALEEAAVHDWNSYATFSVHPLLLRDANNWRW